jgi:hypothetical protein
VPTMFMSPPAGRILEHVQSLVRVRSEVHTWSRTI